MRLPDIWLGSDESFYAYLTNLSSYLGSRSEYLMREETMAARLEDDGMTLSEYLAERLITIQDNVGLVNVSGALVSEEGFENIWYGDVAYSTVQNAVHQLLEAPEVAAIGMVWDSPGGDASGVYDFAAFLKDAGKVKPIHSWTGTKALSAAYWGAASTKSVRSSALGETGSIGVVAKFRSYARMLEENGIDTAIARSAPLKALLQPEEPLTAAKQEYLQKKVDQLHTYFVSNMKEARAKLKSSAESEWASGSSFIAKDAIQVGLVDGPEITLGGFVTQLQAQAEKAMAKHNMVGQPMTKKVVLSEQLAAQLMSGITIPGVSLEDQPVAAAAGEPAAGSAADAPTGGEGHDEGAADPAPVEAAAVGASAAAEAKAPASDALQEYLTGRVKALEDELTSLKVEKAQLTDKLAQASGVEALLQPIAIEAITRFQTALGQAPSSLEGLPSRSLSEMYTNVRAELEKRFPTGRQSADGQNGSQQAQTLDELRVVNLAQRRNA